MIPITQKEYYLNRIVGNNNYETPEKPITTEEFFFAEILGEAVQAPEPLTRYQMFLAKIAGREIEIPYPETRLEYFLAKAAGMKIETPTPITREEIFWSNYTAIVDFEVEGVPPLTYKAIEGTLENYRIYGNTVDGESVGDRTGNLFDEKQQMTTGVITNDGTIDNTESSCEYSDFIEMLPNVDYTIRATYSTQKYIRVVFYDSSKNFIERVLSTSITPTITFNKNANYIRICVDKGWSTIMLNAGSAPLPYEPYGYKVPVTVSNGTDTLTTPIYLPEPIKMVGNEAEYIDYGEQKQHRVRKNLLKITTGNRTMGRDNDDPVTYPGVTITINTDKSVTLNGRSRPTLYIPIGSIDDLKKGSYYLSGCPINGADNSYKLYVQNQSITSFDIGSGVRFDYISSSSTLSTLIRLYGGYTCDNLTFYPMVRKADITDDTYEPYIENTDLDVTLPELPTLTGTNVLTVGTAVQPSKVYVKGQKEREYS